MRRFLEAAKQFIFHGVLIGKLGGLFLGAVFLAGGVFWWQYLAIEQPFYINHDWPNVYYYLNVIIEALASGQLPLHVSVAIQGTDKFLANPETPLSPQSLLLGVLAPKPFVLANLLVLYTVGFVGVYKLAKEFSLSAFSFLVFFLLFNFNGHLLAHISVGHYMWVSYYLLPFVLLFSSRLVRGIDTTANRAWLALSLFAMVLQGGVHLFIFCIMFLFLVAVWSPAARKALLISLAYATVLSLCRLAPAMLVYFYRSWTSGYPSLLELVRSLVVITPDNQYLIRETGFWEYNLYIGIVGAFFLLLFGIWPLVRGRVVQPQFRRLALPLLLMSLLSLGYIYQSFAEFIDIAFLKIERVPARFLIIPFAYLLLLATIQFNRWLQKQSLSIPAAVASLAALAYGSERLVFHARVWRLRAMTVRYLQDGEPGELLHSLRLVPGDDMQYYLVLAIAWAISLTFLVYLIVKVRKTAQTRRQIRSN